MAKKIGMPFILDTEGAQVRTGRLSSKEIRFNESKTIKIYVRQIIGDKEKVCLKPGFIVKQLEEGDLIFCDFDTLVFKVSDVSCIDKGYVLARSITSGSLQANKSAVITHGTKKPFELPVLTDKDKQAIKIGLSNNLGYIALSFVRDKEGIEELRRVSRDSMRIISKIEARQSLDNVDEIIDNSDAILVDRGDLSKEIPIEKIPHIQKFILEKAKKKNKPVFIATNLLESMVNNKKPTRAEVNDVINTIIDGADGLILSAETAIGAHPMECINMMYRLISDAKSIGDMDYRTYLSNINKSSLIEPHGGRLVERYIDKYPYDIKELARIRLTVEQQMDVEQIAIGAFSPLEGFMVRDDLEGVLDNMRLADGTIWPIPILLDVSAEDAKKIHVGNDLALTDERDEVMALLHTEDIYSVDKLSLVKRLYSTDDRNHPGVNMVMNMKPFLLGGKIDLLRRRPSEHKEYELTPYQTRRLFEDRGWIKVVGFHTRNVVHRGHEFIQLNAMQEENCDGLFIHPVVGTKKPGDFESRYIIRAYEKMMESVYPKNSAVFSAFATFSRYAGPKEALFTALCRKNFGCSHFIVGRDHTGVGNYYHPNASHEIFDDFPDLGIKPIIFDEVIYSDKLKKYIHKSRCRHKQDLQELAISGTEARRIFESLQVPPEWFMRVEISSIILDALKKKEKVFV